MPLPEPAPRHHLHQRQVVCDGYEREDGLFDIDARVTDRRHYDLMRPDGVLARADKPVHDMWLRLTVDRDLTIVAVQASTDHAPFPVCTGGAAEMQKLVGERIGRGFSRRSRELLGGPLGCTHLLELLGPAATTAFQTLVKLRFEAPDRLDAKGRPVKIDSCYGYAANRDVVRQRWPEHYTRDDAAGT